MRSKVVVNTLTHYNWGKETITEEQSCDNQSHNPTGALAQNKDKSIIGFLEWQPQKMFVLQMFSFLDVLKVGMSRVAPRKAIWLEQVNWTIPTVQSTQSYNNADQSVSSWMARAYRWQRRQHYTIWQYRLKAISPGGHHLLPDRPQLQLFEKLNFWNCLESKCLLTMCIALCVTLFPRVWQFSPLFPKTISSPGALHYLMYSDSAREREQYNAFW